MRPCLWKCFITLQSFITERCSPRDRSYITTVQFSLPQQSKDWSTVRTPFTDGISEGPHGEGSLSTLVDQPHKQCAVVPPSMNPFPSRLVICFRLPHLSFTQWHLETLHALMSLKLSCLPAQPLAPCMCSFLELLFHLNLLVTNSNKMVSMMEIHGDQCSEVSLFPPKAPRPLQSWTIENGLSFPELISTRPLCDHRVEIHLEHNKHLLCGSYYHITCE